MADQSIEGWQDLDHQLRQYRRLSPPSWQTTGNASFSMFKSLPRKLKDQIWTECFPEPRIVEVRFVGFPFHKPSPRIPSPILHTCHESRIKMLESFLPLYHSESRLPTLYINPEIDAFFINEYMHKLDKVIPEFSPRIFGSLRHPVVESERVLRHPSYSNASMDKLTKFANLEKLTMSTPPTKPDFRGGG